MKTLILTFGFAIIFSLVAGTRISMAEATTDINMSVPLHGGPIVITGGTSSGESSMRIFQGFLVTSGTSSSTTDPGLFAPSATFASGDRIRMDFVRELLFWNGTSLASPSAAFQVRNSTRSATITGTSTSGGPGIFVSTVPVAGGYHVHPTYSVPATAADGLYGVVMTLGPDGATTGFTTSAPFLITFEKGQVANYQAGIDAMANAALVPEPGALALAAGGIAAAAAMRWRRRATIAPSCNPIA